MPIGSEATDSAAAEAGVWAASAAEWRSDLHPGVWADLAPREAVVVRFYDPSADLVRRAGEWGFDPAKGELADLAVFAAGLAMAEAEAWSTDRPHVATRALETRRFLLTDRILHWAVPWLDAVGRGYPEERKAANRTRDQILSIGEQMRCAPVT